MFFLLAVFSALPTGAQTRIFQPVGDGLAFESPTLAVLGADDSSARPGDLLSELRRACRLRYGENRRIEAGRDWWLRHPDYLERVFERAGRYLRGNTIRAGRHLLIPVSTRPLSAYREGADERLGRTRNRARAGNRRAHNVARGESFWSISRRYEVTMRELAA